MYNAPEIKLSIIHPTWANTPLLADNISKMEKRGMKIINPQTVSDAVCGQ